MDNENTNPGEHKPRRPRIGQNRVQGSHTGGYSTAPYGDSYSRPAQQDTGREPGEHMRRTYGTRQGAYDRRPAGRDTSDSSGYQDGRPQRRQYNNQPQGDGYYGNDRASSDGNNDSYRQRQGGYQQRQDGYQQRQGGYQQRQDGYQQRQGGYQQRQGGYQQNRDGYQHRQGGYQQNRDGYQQRDRQGGQYNNNNRPQQGANRRYKGQQHGAMPSAGKTFTPRPRQVEYEMPIPDPNELIRLNKFMANSGICSRREADEFIRQGLVKVNGQVVTELGTKITHSDVVEYDDKVVALQRKCYVLLNKPKDCVTTSDDPNGRLTVLDIVKGACKERIYPVGRLDRNTTGVLLLTNDGDLASQLTHPKYIKKKIYHVWTDRDISEEDMQRIADGIELEDGEIHADAISYATETDRNQAGIEIHSGRNRIVRRIFEHLGYRVVKLDRVYFAGLTKKNLPRGRWRYLTQEEVNYLKMGSFE